MAVSRKRYGMVNRMAADKRAKALAPVIRELRNAGFVSIRAIANELNKRKIKSAYGGRWHPTSVVRLLGRLW